MHLRVAVPPPPPKGKRKGGNVDENLTPIVFCENIIRVCMGIFTLRSRYNNTSHFYCALLVV